MNIRQRRDFFILLSISISSSSELLAVALSRIAELENELENIELLSCVLAPKRK